MTDAAKFIVVVVVVVKKLTPPQTFKLSNHVCRKGRFSKRRAAEKTRIWQSRSRVLPLQEEQAKKYSLFRRRKVVVVFDEPPRMSVFCERTCSFAECMFCIVLLF